MKCLDYRDGLLYTSVSLLYKDKELSIDDIIVDTGAFHTIINPDYLEKLGADFSDEDELVKASGYGGTVSYAIRKSIDCIKCEDIYLANVKLDFGEIDPKERVNGLLGLDFLIGAGVVVDLANLTMCKKMNE